MVGAKKFSTLLREGRKLTDDPNIDVIKHIINSARTMPRESVYRAMPYMIPALIDRSSDAADACLNTLSFGRTVVSGINMVEPAIRKAGDDIFNFVKTMSEGVYEIATRVTEDYQDANFASFAGLLAYKSANSNKYIIAGTSDKTADDETVILLFDADTSKYVSIYRDLGKVLISTEKYYYNTDDEQAAAMSMSDIWKISDKLARTSGREMIATMATRILKHSFPSSEEFSLCGNYGRDESSTGYQFTISPLSKWITFGAISMDIVTPGAELWLQQDMFDIVVSHLFQKYFKVGQWYAEVHGCDVVVKYSLSEGVLSRLVEVEAS